MNKANIYKIYPFPPAEMKIVEIQAVSGRSLFPVDTSPPLRFQIAKNHGGIRPPTRGPDGVATHTRLWSLRHL